MRKRKEFRPNGDLDAAKDYIQFRSLPGNGLNDSLIENKMYAAYACVYLHELLRTSLVVKFEGMIESSLQALLEFSGKFSGSVFHLK